MTGGEQHARRPGRRPGANETREAILVAARDAFAAHGYEKATIRGIARAAGVDPALVHHFYGPKEEVFRAAVGDVLAPISAAIHGAGRGADPAEAAARLASTLVALWGREPTKGALLGALRAAVTSETAAGLVRQIVQEHTVAAIAASTDRPDAELRANLIGSTIVGIALTRYVLELEPIASLDERRLGAVFAGVIAYYLDAELGGADDGPSAPTGPDVGAAR
jgi:AcrR family transcriptional regulator